MEQLQAPGDRGEGVGLQFLEGQRLHLVHDLVHADALGQRGVDIHRLAGDPPALVAVGHVMQRAHVVQPVGELDQQHADVVAQREQELAQILRGALILRLRLDLAAAWSPRRPAGRCPCRTAARFPRWSPACPRWCRGGSR